MLTMQDAEWAFELIKNKYGPYIAPELARRTAASVYRFCSEDEFAAAFQMSYAGAFKEANALLIPDLIGPCDINGFVSAEADHDARRIYIPTGPAREPIERGTLAHEAVHFFSHKDFYPNYYVVGGFHPFQVEGATEYLTRMADSSLATRKSYQSHFLRTKAWMGGHSGNYARMVAFLFQGTATDLDSIRP